MPGPIQNLDMKEELFLGPFTKFKVDIPPEPEEHCLKLLREGLPARKMLAIMDIVQLYRAKAGETGYTREIAAAVTALLRANIADTQTAGFAAHVLLSEALRCEDTGDFQGAAWFYEASQGFGHTDPESRYYCHNNMGFSLLYLKKFDEAKVQLEAAFAILPKRYNVWKNYGVALECQGDIKGAAKAFMFAINYSGAEQRSVRHLMRLIARHPELRADEYLQGYLDSLVKHGVIPKNANA